MSEMRVGSSTSTVRDSRLSGLLKNFGMLLLWVEWTLSLTMQRTMLRMEENMGATGVARRCVGEGPSISRRCGWMRSCCEVAK